MFGKGKSGGKSGKGGKKSPMGKKLTGTKSMGRGC